MPQSESQRHWDKEHKEHIRQRHKRWRDNNATRLRQKRRSRYRNDPKKQHVHNQVYQNNQRAIKKGAKGKVTYHQWIAIKARYENTCLMCGKPETSNGELLTMDHIIPLSKGGNHLPENLQPLCHKCNNNKWTSINDLRPDRDSIEPSVMQLSLFENER